MSRHSGGVLVAAALICVYFTGAIGTAIASQEVDRRQTLAFTDVFLAQAGRRSASRIAAVKAVNAGRTGQTASTMMPMTPVLPLFVAEPNFTSSLIMVNITNVATYADVVLTGLNGKEITEKRIQLAPRSQESVDIGALLTSVASPATTGRVTVTQDSMFMGMIGAQLLLTYSGSAEPNYIDEDEAMPSPTGSQVLRGVADDPSASPVLAVTSLSNMPQTLAIECSAEAGVTFTKSVALPAQGTLIAEACSGRAIANGDLESIVGPQNDKQRESRPLGISLTTNAMPGSFAAFGLTPHKDGQRKYFSNIAFSDPKTILSSTTVFTGVPVGFSTPMPAGSYTPQLSLANFSRKAAHIEVKYAWTSDDAPTTLDAATLTVPPRATKTVTFANLQSGPSMQNSFLVTSDAAPGDVVAKLVSKSDSALIEAELLAKDEKDPMNSGEHPWSLDQGMESTLLLFNHSLTSEGFEVVIDGGGVIWQKVYRLQPLQTTSIQLQDLIDNQVKDDKGKAIPRGTLDGVVNWFTSGPGIGKGRLLISSQIAVMARSFSCYEYTIVYGGVAATQLTNDVLTGQDGVALAEANQNVASASTLTPPHCSGEPISGSIFNLTYSWTSENTGVATISNGNGQDVYVNGVGGGETTIEATLTDQYGCQGVSPATVTVQVPTSLSIVAGTSSTTTESPCTTSNGLAGCGVTRTFTYQVNDQNGQPIKIANMPVGDVICNTSTDNLNLQGYTTSCGGTTGSCSGTAGPCGKYTNANGQFPEMLSVCAPACKTSGTCTTAGQTIANQTWTVSGTALNSDVKSISYQCNKILVNGS